MKPIQNQFPICYRVCFVLAALLASGSVLHAQGYASISGTISDPNGALVPSATVTAIQTETGRATIVNSSQNGAFVFPTLLPSNYSLTVTAQGFQKYTQSNVVLQADQAVTVNVNLTIGSTSTTVEVTSAVPQIDTTSGTMSEVIDHERVVELPLNGRNAAALTLLVAGVADATNQGNGVNQGNGKTFPAAVVTTVNGTLPNQSNYLLNGGNNVDEMTNVNGPFPFPDALQEFSVQTSNYNAEFGQSAGAVVNIVTKAGSRQFHGNLFEFLRNGYFNARAYFTTVDTLHRHQFGGTIGGPVIIPHISTGARTQFFFGYQHTLNHSSSNGSTTTVPTLAEEGRTGTGYADFGNFCTGGWDSHNICLTPSQTITNPFTNVPYALNRIPASDFDPASVNYEKAFPTYSGTEKAGVIGGPVNYLKSTITDYDEYIGRVDHDFSQHDHLFGHYYYNFYNQPAIYDSTNLASYTSYFNTRYQNALLSYTHTFTVNLLNNLVLNYQREIALRGGPPGSPNITDFGVNNIWQPNTGPYLSASVTGYFGASSSAFAGWYRNNYTFNDDLHWVKGNHNIAFGGHVEISKFDVTNVFTSYGGFTFGTAINAITTNGVKSTYYYPNAAANFQLGFMTGFGQGNYELVNDRNHFPGVYAQDSWKVNRRLTLNYGLRWEAFAPWANNVSKQTAFSPANYIAKQGTPQYTTLPAGMVLSGDPGFPQNGVRNKYTQFMPRVGFAVDLTGNGRTVLRGGTGIFYQDRLPGFFNLNQAGLVPNTISVSLSNLGMAGAAPGANPGGRFSNPYCTGCAVGAYANPFPFTLPFPSSQVFPNAFQLAEYDPSGNFQIPVTYDYNLILEQQLASSLSFRVAYVGSGSRHQFVNLEINPSVNTGSGLSTNQRRVYNTAPVVGPCASATGCTTSYSQIILASMSGNAHYNSLQATIDKRLNHGLSLLFNYTWSKSYDDMPQATRVSNTEDLNAGASYVYPLYPSNATGIPASAFVPDIKALDRGVSDLDHTNVISASYVYDLPKLHGSNGFVRAIVNGWRTSGLITHRSGDALTIWTGTDNSLTGLSQDRGQRDFTRPAYLYQVGGGNCTAGKSCVNWLNPSAFSVPKQNGPGTGFGNVVKDSLRGPGVTNWDAAMTRSFPIWRESTLDFRAEYFDVLNHTELANPQVSASNAAFGTITGTQGGPRIAQFALKFLF